MNNVQSINQTVAIPVIVKLKEYVKGISENAFVQRIVLSGVCQQLHWLVSAAGEQYTATKDELDHLTPDETGEINKLRVSDLKKRINNILDQEEDASNALASAKELYKEVTGDDWKPAVKGGSKVVNEEAVDARIAAREARRAKTA